MNAHLNGHLGWVSVSRSLTEERKRSLSFAARCTLSGQIQDVQLLDQGVLNGS